MTPSPGLHALQLRDRLVRLASIPDPPGAGLSCLHVHDTAATARVLLTELGADADGFLAAIPADEFLTEQGSETPT